MHSYFLWTPVSQYYISCNLYFMKTCNHWSMHHSFLICLFDYLCYIINAYEPTIHTRLKISTIYIYLCAPSISDCPDCLDSRKLVFGPLFIFFINKIKEKFSVICYLNYCSGFLTNFIISTLVLRKSIFYNTK